MYQYTHILVQFHVGSLNSEESNMDTGEKMVVYKHASVCGVVHSHGVLHGLYVVSVGCESLVQLNTHTRPCVVQ